MWTSVRFFLLWPIVFTIEFGAVLLVLELSTEGHLLSRSEILEAVGYATIIFVPVVVLSVLLPLLAIRIAAPKVPNFALGIQLAPYFLMGVFSIVFAMTREIDLGEIWETPFLLIVFIVYAGTIHGFEFRHRQLMETGCSVFRCYLPCSA
ncbi:hypothetical protein [Glycomyces salinus]|uniref:hypothetical protein n=1 Tax=Glycomyces salinus TaxID=980294 RepID=UPI0018EDA1C4|nr:hypothetical protein [Glycomyces salinus]